MHKAAGLLMVAFLTACASTGGQPKAYRQLASVVDAPPVRPVDYDGAPLVMIAADVMSGFRFLYRFVDETEFVLCLEGARTGGRVYVTGFRLAQIKSTSPHTVAYEECANRDYIGTAHNHPPIISGTPLCYQSAADEKSFRLDQRALLDIVLCGEERYFWILRDGRSRVEDRARQR